MKKALYYFFTILFLSVSSTLFAQDALAKKETQFKGVYDYANMLSAGEKNALAQKLLRYADSTSTQIAVATIKTLNGDDISRLAVEKAHEWGIGQKGKDNGVFILVAQQERKIKIATGYGVEHLLTDLLSKEIIDQVITPNFKQQQYYQGFNQATDYIFKILAGEYKADPTLKKRGKKGKGNFLFIIVIIIVLFFLFRNKGGNDSNGNNHRNNRSRESTAADIITSILLSGMGSSRSSGGFGGGGFGGSSGGGFGGFGGGGFGGGGASGGW